MDVKPDDMVVIIPADKPNDMSVIIPDDKPTTMLLMTLANNATTC